MKIAIVGSRGLRVENLGAYLPEGVREIVSGGARGIYTCAKEYAAENNLKLTVFLPQYKRFGRVAPLKRNEEIIEYADEVIALWDGVSSGTKHVIDACERAGKPITVVVIKSSRPSNE